ncbi:MAG: YdcF family protein [Nitrospinales bacterium]
MALYLLLVTTHGFWLRLAADFLLIGDSVQKTELIIVSTGSYARFRYAVELTLEGRAGNLLILGNPLVESPIPGKSFLVLSGEEAVSRGLSRRRFALKNSASTLGDARAAEQYMASRGFATAAVISDGYNMRRVAMIFDRVFEDAPIQLRYVPVELERNRLHPGQWWKYPDEFNYVLKEWIKLPLDFIRVNFLSS